MTPIPLINKVMMVESESFKVYKITHAYDIGDQSIYIKSKSDPTLAAIYCQFAAEGWFDEYVSLSTFYFLLSTFYFLLSTFAIANAYKQIGNGVSRPVGTWIGNEMKRYMECCY